MPKLPRGMFLRKGRGYYTRRWADGKDRWIALGKDFDEACRKLRSAEGCDCAQTLGTREGSTVRC